MFLAIMFSVDLDGPTLAPRFPITTETSILHFWHGNLAKIRFQLTVLHHLPRPVSWNKCFACGCCVCTGLVVSLAQKCDETHIFSCTNRVDTMILHDFLRRVSWKQCPMCVGRRQQQTVRNTTTPISMHSPCHPTMTHQKSVVLVISKLNRGSR